MNELWKTKLRDFFAPRVFLLEIKRNKLPGGHRNDVQDAEKGKNFPFICPILDSNNNGSYNFDKPKE